MTYAPSDPTRDRHLEEALAYVYIAQYVRGRDTDGGPSSAGVTRYDCQSYQSLLEELASKGDIEMVRWYTIDGFRVTAQGTRTARQIVLARLTTHRDQLISHLNQTPPRVVQYILQEIILADDMGRVEGSVVSPSRDIGSYEIQDWMQRRNHSCLLRNRELLTARDSLFQFLTTKGLMATAQDYVSTRKGELRERKYVPALELKVFCKDYLVQSQIADVLWPGELEDLHTLFHLLDIRSPGSTLQRDQLDMRAPVRLREALRAFLNDCLSEGLLREFTETTRESRIFLQVTDILGYQDLLSQRFWNPLVEFLLVPSNPHEPSRTVESTGGSSLPGLTPRVETASISSFRVLLGSADSETAVYWEPLAVPNPHLLIVGSPGTGKTQTAKALIYEAKLQGVNAFAIDFANEYGDSNLVNLVLRPGDGVTVNPLDLLEGGPTDVVFRVSGVLKKIFRLGDQQEGLVRDAVKDAYASAGITDDRTTWTKAVPPFSRIKAYLEELAGGGKGPRANMAQRTLTRLEPLFDLKVFAANTQVAFDRILDGVGSLFLRDLPTEETKLAVAEFFLRWLWHRVISEGEIRSQLRLLIVMDEAHKLAYDNSPVADFLRQGRKYGAAVVLSTQQPNDFQAKELAFQNTAYHIAFGCNSDTHAQAMAKQMVIGRPNQRRVAEIIRGLKPFEALVSGQATAKGQLIHVLPYYKRAP